MVLESEKHIERKLVEAVRKKRGMCVKMLCDQLTGLPDRLCLLPGGKIFFVEVKSTGKVPRPVQKAVHNRLRSLGFEVFVIDTAEGINSIIKP